MISAEVVSNPKNDGKQYTAIILPNMGGNADKDIRASVSDDGCTLTVVFVLGGDLNCLHKYEDNEKFANYAIKEVGGSYDKKTHRSLVGTVAQQAWNMLDGKDSFGLKYTFGLPFACSPKFSTMVTTLNNTSTLKLILVSKEEKLTIVKKKKKKDFTLDDESDTDEEEEEEDSPITKRYRRD